MKKVDVKPVPDTHSPLGTVLLQTGIGYFCGHVINTFNLYMNPGKVILGAPPVLVINPLKAGACSLIFALVDRIAIYLLQGDTKNYSPKQQLIRMAVTIPLSTAISYACLGVSFNVAAIAITTSIFALTKLLSTVKDFNQLAYN